LKKIKHWFIGELLAKTEDVFEKAKIELVFNFSVFFMVLGLLFYGNLIANGLWYHFYMITFGIFALASIPFILKYKQSLRMAANWYVIQQTITSTISLGIQEFKPDMSGPLWTLSFIIFVIFIFGVRQGLPRLIPFILLFLATVYLSSNNIIIDLGIPDDQQLPNQPFVTLIPFYLCFYLIIVFVRTNTVAQIQIKEKTAEINLKNKEITDSINYAKRIQKAVLPIDNVIEKALPNSFVLFKPKDIVSGDFYWFHQLDENSSIIICADCTGHGVPGAFMTVVGCNLLNNIIIENKVHQPKDILKTLDEHISSTLKQDQQTGHYVPDGMDLTLLKINKIENEFILCSAKRPTLVYQNGKLEEIRGNKFSLGGIRSDIKSFEEIIFPYKKGDAVYLYTDGYVDQFGGPANKKFMTKRFKETVSQLLTKPIAEQKVILDIKIENWKNWVDQQRVINEYEQTDDIQVIGIQF
jgi:hypothetical protein